MCRLIGICGGIGSGKSVVSRILRNEGYLVLDCDFEAGRIMSESTDIKRRIRDEISAEVTDGISSIDRKKLASIVFGDEKKRLLLNSIVHGAVVREVQRKSSEAEDELMFAEAAVMAESGLADICDDIWEVVADTEERISRVTARDGSDRTAVESRMKAQRQESQLLRKYRYKIKTIRNDNSHSLFSQIQAQLNSYKTIHENQIK